MRGRLFVGPLLLGGFLLGAAAFRTAGHAQSLRSMAVSAYPPIDTDNYPSPHRAYRGCSSAF